MQAFLIACNYYRSRADLKIAVAVKNKGDGSRKKIALAMRVI
jgi:hypothetical protein